MIDKIQEYSRYMIAVSILVAYFVFQSLLIGQSIVDMLSDFKGVIHLIFSIFAQVFLGTIGYDDGLTKALVDERFIEANTANEEYIKYFNEHFDDLFDYTDYLTENEKKTVVKDFLRGVGKRSVDDLTKKELRQFKKLKPKKHSTKGANLPLYYKHQSGDTITYDASFHADKYKLIRTIRKIAFGMLGGLMTIEVIFMWNNVGQALASTFILLAMMVISYLMQFLFPYNRLTKIVPQEVKSKKILYDGLKTFQKKERSV